MIGARGNLQVRRLQWALEQPEGSFHVGRLDDNDPESGLYVLATYQQPGTVESVEGIVSTLVECSMPGRKPSPPATIPENKYDAWLCGYKAWLAKQ